MQRREFLKCSLPLSAAMLSHRDWPARAAADEVAAPGIIDTNVWLFDWPFRELKYRKTTDLVAKLRQHRVEQAWAGSYESLLHKNLSEVNARLTAECKRAGDKLLVPFGSVNPVWPDWREELRRCHEVHRMPGIRLTPSYHHYGFHEPEFAELLAGAAERGLIVQIACELEDPRVHHPALSVAAMDYSPLAGILQKIPAARVQLLHWFGGTGGKTLNELVDKTSVLFDISNIEGNGGVGRLIDGNTWSPVGQVPRERLLFGSHAPLFPCESAVLKLFESPLERESFQQIASGNARELMAHRLQPAVRKADWPAETKGIGWRSFPFDPAAYGVPSRDELVALRIWDLHYHGFNADDPLPQHEAVMPYVERMGIERVLALDVGGTRRDPFAEPKGVERQRALLEQQSDRVLGLVRIDPSDPAASCQKMEKWIARGPCIGIKYAGFNRDGLTCSHANNVPIIRLAEELKALVYIHTWLKIGGQPRRPGGDNNPGESTPMDVAQLAERFPNMPLICGHSGGDWELGIRAIRPYKNVYLEFAGSDPHSGQVDLAVAELGIDRIVWGGHGPSRSYATELSKVLDADLTLDQRRAIFGGNLRRIAAPILKHKGYRF